jgi:hypothetical protein
MKTKLRFLNLFLCLSIVIFSCTKQNLKEPISSTSLQASSEENAGKYTPPNDSTNNFAGDGFYDLLGFGYDATKEFANANSAGFKVINLSALSTALPDRLVTGMINSQEYYENYGADARAYSFYLSSSVDNTLSLPLFKKVLSAGFSSSVTTTGKFDGKYVWGSYNLTIKQKRVSINSDVSTLQNFLTPEFIQDVDTYYTNPQVLVQKYGTHVLLDIFTGAKLELLFQSETVNSNRTSAARVGIKVGVATVFGINISNDVNTATSDQNYSRKLYYATRGGNPAFGLTGTLNLDQTNPTINFTNWQNSSTTSNSVLVDIGQAGMFFLYDFIADPAKKSIVKNYIDQYLINNQTFVDHLAIPIYRFYNPSSAKHLYTVSSTTPPSYNYEGMAFNAFSYQTPNTVPIYRYFNPGNGDHFYTKTLSNPSGYNYEGVSFYAYPTQTNNSGPVYRFYNPGTGDHLYQTLGTAPSGYNSEGIEFYAL